MGYYVAPGSTNSKFTTVSEVEPLFTPALQRLQTLNPGTYAQGYKSTLGPLSHDNKLKHQPKAEEAFTNIDFYPLVGISPPFRRMSAGK